MEALAVIHPERTRRASETGYSFRTLPDGTSEQTHAPTRDRYLRTIWKARLSAARSESLLLWEVRKGAPEQEEVTIDRALQLGRYRIRY